MEPSYTQKYKLVLDIEYDCMAGSSNDIKLLEKEILKYLCLPKHRIIIENWMAGFIVRHTVLNEVE